MSHQTITPAQLAAHHRRGRDWIAVLVRQVLRGEREYVFHPTRRWRFDLAFLHEKVAVECEGGGFVAGRHSRGAGLEADSAKYAEALCLGWRVLRVTPRQIQTGQAAAWIRRLLA